MAIPPPTPRPPFPPAPAPAPAPLAPISIARGRFFAWYLVGLIGSLIFIGVGYLAGTQYEFTNDAMEDYRGPLEGFYGYMASLLLLPLLCLVLEHKKRRGAVKLAATTFVGTLTPGFLFYLFIIVMWSLVW